MARAKRGDLFGKGPRAMQEEGTSGTRWRVLALHDVVIVVYMIIVAGLLFWRTGGHPGPIIREVFAAIIVVPAAAYVARAVPQVPYWLRMNVYRVILVGTILWSYLMLRDVLPVIRTDSVDDALSAWDQRIFGGQPVLWLEALNKRWFIEWMSFFYWNYYTLLLAHVIGAVWIAPTPRTTSEFGIGTALLFAFGHFGYMAVPAFGPYAYFKDRFQGPLDGTRFWKLVWDSVQAGGALKDVFPSLHTGASTWLALFAVHQAMLDKRWRIPAIITCFFTVNIVVSTIVLRWHYAVDVMAGLVLASSVAFAAAKLAPWEEARRKRLGLLPVWPPKLTAGGETSPKQ